MTCLLHRYLICQVLSYTQQKATVPLDFWVNDKHIRRLHLLVIPGTLHLSISFTTRTYIRPPESYASCVLTVWPVPQSDFRTQIVLSEPQKPRGPILVWGGRTMGRTLGRTEEGNISVLFWLFISAETTSEVDRNQPPLNGSWHSLVWGPVLTLLVHVI